MRAHRLVERWLADHTGVEPGEWHAVAEDAEHAMTHEDTERLAARLGRTGVESLLRDRGLFGASLPAWRVHTPDAALPIRCAPREGRRAAATVAGTP